MLGRHLHELRLDPLRALNSAVRVSVSGVALPPVAGSTASCAGR
jgi:hypothetical protein